MNPATSGTCPSSPGEPTRRRWSFRFRGGPAQTAEGPTAAAAALALGYGFDDFRYLTWEERP